MKIDINNDTAYNELIDRIIEMVVCIPKDKRGRHNAAELRTYCQYIMLVIISGCSWEDLNLIPNMPVKADAIRKKFKLWADNDVFNDIFYELMKVYLTRCNSNETFLDSYDCLNFRGTKKNIGIGHKYKSKYVTKITLLVDNFNMPIAIDISKGNENDKSRIKFIINQIPKQILNLCTYQNPLKIGADKGYITNPVENHNLRKDLHVTIITDKRKNMKRRITKEHKDFLRRRIKIEHLNSTLKGRFKHLSRITDKNEKSIKRWFILSFCYLLIENEHKFLSNNLNNFL